MKSKFYLLTLTFVLSITALTTNAAMPANSQPEQTTQSTTLEQTDSRMTEIKQRVEEIRAMDKSQLSREERKDLRRELKDLKKEAKERSGGGIYLSLGALIIVILLLIIIL